MIVVDEAAALPEIQCEDRRICGEHYEGDVPLACEPGDGV